MWSVGTPRQIPIAAILVMLAREQFVDVFQDEKTWKVQGLVFEIPFF